MFYRPEHDSHGLAHNPFKGLVVPRPIAWVSTRGASGVVNLAPYSFFNAVASDPPMVMFASGGAEGLKDSPRNAKDTGEFVVNIVPERLFEAMVATSQAVAEEVDEADLVGLRMLPGVVIDVPRVADSPISLECRFLQAVSLPCSTDGEQNLMTVGRVVGVHIDDGIIHDGRVDVRRFRPLARLGYDEYAVVENATTLEERKR